MKFEIIQHCTPERTFYYFLCTRALHRIAPVWKIFIYLRILTTSKILFDDIISSLFKPHPGRFFQHTREVLSGEAARFRRIEILFINVDV